MKEKVLQNKKNGMAVLMINLLALLLAVVCVVVGGIMLDNWNFMDDVAGIILMVIGAIGLCVGWIPLIGLKVLKPQEALVLTLFGDYIGTLKGEGFYWVNPFCSAINPGAGTKLGQSGDVKTVG